jgi:hypothetical protein
MTQRTAPVVLLGFNRPDLTERVFRTIRQAQPTQLFLVMDGPRDSHPADAELVAETRAVVSRVDWDCEVIEDFSQTNLGLKARISSGLDRVFAQTEAAIILEDDCVPDQSFFSFATELLQRYREDPRVGLIGGTSRLRGHRVGPYSYDFSGDVRIWGWATWSRTWVDFQQSGDLESTWSAEEQKEILEAIPDGARKRALRSQLARAQHLDSWALPFAIHCQRKGYLSVVPEVNLVENVGFGARSTHTVFEDYVSQVPASPLQFPLRHPEQVRVNPEVDIWESRLDAREWLAYPIRHPLDFLGRAWRFVWQKFGRNNR